MSSLNLNSNFADADAFYTALINGHRGLSDSDSTALNARLILILANHIGDHAVLLQALDVARRSLDETLSPHEHT